MAIHDNMTPSPKRPSSERKDDNDASSPKKRKRAISDEGNSSKKHDIYRDDVSSKRSIRDDNEKCSNVSRDRRKRTESPIQGPSSSKRYSQDKSQGNQEYKSSHREHSSLEHRYSEEDYRSRRPDQDNFSSRYRRESSQSDHSNTKDQSSRQYSKLDKEATCSKSPVSSSKYNEGYGKILPPGAKGNYYIISLIMIAF